MARRATNPFWVITSVWAVALVGFIAAAQFAPPEQDFNSWVYDRDSRFSHAAQKKRYAWFKDHQASGHFQRLGEPRKGQWFHAHREAGQTIAEYLADLSNQRTDARDKIYLQPFDDLANLHQVLMPVLSDYVARFFGVPVTVLNPRRVPAGSLNPRRLQLNADRLMASLRFSVPSDGLAMLGLSGSDIYLRNTSFVLGVGEYWSNTGVHSMHRIGGHVHIFGEDQDFDAPEEQIQARALKVAAHEIGHMLGLKHCVYYRCIMNGAASVEELDTLPHHLCPACREKLQRNLGFDAQQRYRKLRAFYRKHKMHREAAFVAAQLE